MGSHHHAFDLPSYAKSSHRSNDDINNLLELSWILSNIDETIRSSKSDELEKRYPTFETSHIVLHAPSRFLE